MLETETAPSTASLEEVLEKATHEELSALVELLTNARRCTLSLSERDISLIAQAVKSLGSNYLMFQVAGSMTPYESIVKMVAKKVGAKFKKGAQIPDIEWAIVSHLAEKAAKNLTPEQREAMQKDLENLEGRKIIGATLGVYLLSATSPVLQQALSQAVATQLLGRAGIQYVGTPIAATLPAISFWLGPLAWALGGFGLIWALTGPAYKVSVPAVVLIATMRARQRAEESAAELREAMS